MLGQLTIPAIALDTDSQPHETWFSLQSKQEALEGSLAATKAVKAAHVWIKSSSSSSSSNASSSSCAACSKMIWKKLEWSSCSICNISCHAKCQSLIADNCGSVGAVRISYVYTREPILPLRCYGKLKDIILDPYLTTITIFAKVCDDKEAVALNLLNVCDGVGKSAWFVSSVCAKEIRETKTPTTLFRANSLATKAFDVYMKHVGLSFLRQIVHQTIKDICRSNVNVEIDEMKMEEKDRGDAAVLKERTKIISGHVTTLLTKLQTNLSSCPPGMRAVFTIIFKQSQQTFLQNNHSPNSSTVEQPAIPNRSNINNINIPYIAVTSFLFLRYITSAILSPKLWNLIDDEPSSKATRCLTLVAKTLQQCANLTEFNGAKEAWIVCLNGCVRRSIPVVKTIVREFCALEGEKRRSKEREKECVAGGSTAEVDNDENGNIGSGSTLYLGRRTSLKGSGSGNQVTASHVDSEATTSEDKDKETKWGIAKWVQRFKARGKKGGGGGSNNNSSENIASARTSQEFLDELYLTEDLPTSTSAEDQQILLGTDFIDEVGIENADIERHLAAMHRRFEKWFGKMKEVCEGQMESEAVQKLGDVIRELEGLTGSAERKRMRDEQLAKLGNVIGSGGGGALGGEADGDDGDELLGDQVEFIERNRVEPIAL
ncbi:hypothetical protein HDU76_004154 [Blyttiomyces sp. JEL0837]|nr:hypothetical protein HDU76_004154 [Blyttiomyces sp. JEL0837]